MYIKKKCNIMQKFRPARSPKDPSPSRDYLYQLVSASAPLIQINYPSSPPPPPPTKKKNKKQQQHRKEMQSSRLADTKAADLQSQNWKGTSTDGSDTKLFIGGEFVSSMTSKWIDVHDPVRVSMLNVHLSVFLILLYFILVLLITSVGVRCFS